MIFKYSYIILSLPGPLNFENFLITNSSSSIKKSMSYHRNSSCFLVRNFYTILQFLINH